ncbi:MAG: MogA/MoaB family molybdenum cofactor biosynthesis protein [Actinobacteria bacterium]|nr:MogA/MoaB family molybdenum cofactor biosynthesis protein [Actinomycetota bacterium]
MSPTISDVSERAAGNSSAVHRAKVLTVSDSVDAGTREDLGGAALVNRLGDAGLLVIEHRVVADSVEEVANALSYMSYGFNGLIVTTGGTGFGPRDVTPEGTARVIDRSAPGLAEAMRAVNPLGRLSRGLAGIRGAALIVNTPGNPSGAVEMLEAILDVVEHAVDLLGGSHGRHD